MTRIMPVQLTLFTLPNLPVRAYSYKRAVENGLNPRTYKVPDEPMDAEAFLSSKYGEKVPVSAATFGILPMAESLCCTPTTMPMTAAIRLVMG